MNEACLHPSWRTSLNAYVPINFWFSTDSECKRQSLTAMHDLSLLKIDLINVLKAEIAKLSLLFCPALFLVGSTQAQQKSASTLENEITSAVKAKTAPADDKSLSADVDNKTTSDVGRSVIQSAITAR